MCNPCPKPGPKRRGRAIQRNKKLAIAAKRRDGACLYGLVYKDGCVPGYDAAHIKSWGLYFSEADVLENVISLCRKHHNLHEDGRISNLTLQVLLYHFYGYGPEDWLVDRLDYIKDIASDYGLGVSFRSPHGNTIECHFQGVWTNFVRIYTLDFLESVQTDTFIGTIANDVEAGSRGWEKSK